MGIAISLFLFAVGAILTFATDVSLSGLNLDVVGVILMLVGIVAFVLNLVVWGPRRRRVVRTAPDVAVERRRVVPGQVVEERRVAPPRQVVEERRVAPREVVEERRVYEDPPL
jgi:Domain of unknown function (DUF6458)